MFMGPTEIECLSMQEFIEYRYLDPLTRYNDMGLWIEIILPSMKEYTWEGVNYVGCTGRRYAYKLRNHTFKEAEIAMNEFIKTKIHDGKPVTYLGQTTTILH